MKLNLLIILVLLLSISCKKDKQSNEGLWTLKNYSVIYYDQTGNEIFESKPEELLQFSKIQITQDSIGVFLEKNTNKSQSQIKTNPASLVSLSLQKALNTVQVRFKTATELSTSHWDIQRSGNAINFLLIATITAKGNLITASDYSFTDNSPLFGKNYYSLIQVDNDGKSVQFGIVPITIDFPLLQINGSMNLPVDLINHTFKKVAVAFTGGKMIWSNEVENTVYFENGMPKSAAKAKLQMEFVKN